MEDFKTVHAHVLVWLEEAAENLRQSLKRSLQVDQKTGASDLVTEMDKAEPSGLVALKPMASQMAQPAAKSQGLNLKLR